ncbi:DUF1445 domain-containing protein [Acidaminobacter sp. JC074]|uniref:D-glutamate cyclase n=1 Tax=Acidaminobacter sp. JC074 TaxID=2530199 RepID=UPI001F0EA957|nr:DUF1445 domain-containing protein [Acidaminobacter sp. JC074]MCH4890837.1 DUF1445 domain-containing protein [Acidaminobacter sp. JC074]
MIREKIRNNEFDRPTSGLLSEYLQVNVMILPIEHADDFEEFCKKNKKACPLIERSDFDLNFTDKTIDIKRDIPRYFHYRNGTKVEELLDLSQVDLTDYVAFTLGCSFSFEHALLSENIKLRHFDEGKNVAMYETSIPCESSDIFSGKMVVSMRPIKKNDIEHVIHITSDYVKTHGIPIHIGHPSAIGIKDLQSPDYGDHVEVKEDELPVFWACGITALNSIKNSLKEDFYTHAPGHMLITNDLLRSIKGHDIEEALNGMLLWKTYNRGLSGLVMQNELKKMASFILDKNHITLVTGFAIRSSMSGETDGPLGAMFLARALEILGKEVRVVTDVYSLDQLLGLKKLLKLNTEVTGDFSYSETDCIFAIERPGKSNEGTYNNMRGNDISDIVEDTDTMIESYINKGTPFIALGDGGNEVGFGKVYDYIKDHVPSGDKICANLAAKELLVAGVSNWGAYVLVAMMEVLTAKNLLHDLELEKKALACIVSLGSVDGLTGERTLSVDGYSLEENLDYLNRLHKIIKK